MTKEERLQHKRGNQIRKLAILTGKTEYRHKVIQHGVYTNRDTYRRLKLHT